MAMILILVDIGLMLAGVVPAALSLSRWGGKERNALPLLSVCATVILIPFVTAVSAPIFEGHVYPVNNGPDLEVLAIVVLAAAEALAIISWLAAGREVAWLIWIAALLWLGAIPAAFGALGAGSDTCPAASNGGECIFPSGFLPGLILLLLLFLSLAVIVAWLIIVITLLARRSTRGPVLRALGIAVACAGATLVIRLPLVLGTFTFDLVSPALTLILLVFVLAACAAFFWQRKVSNATLPPTP